MIDNTIFTMAAEVATLLVFLVFLGGWW